jgi:hypothetical protein
MADNPPAMHKEKNKMRLRNLPLYLVALAGLVLVACGGGEPAEEDVPIVRANTYYYAEWPVRTYVIRDAAAWTAVWQEPVNLGNPVPELPAVDFSTRAVLGVSQRWVDGCGNFGIKRVTRRGADVRVEYGTTQPPPDVGCAGILVPAVDFITVPLPVGQVEFVLRDG